MFWNIKSTYFIKNIFEYLIDKIKLNIIRYNKRFQNALDINLINYKFFSGRYIIKESNELFKIYNAFTDTLIFEGNYLNGKGKEYYNGGKLLFEGEYLNGKRNGKGKEYNWFGELKFESEYLNGRRNGKNELYYHDGKIFCEGEYLNNKMWNLKQYDRNGNLINELINGKGYMKIYNMYFELIHEGEFLNGLKNGKGKEYYKNYKLKFEGDYLNGRRWNVKEYDINGNLICELKNGKGYIKEYGMFDQLIYEGNYLYGLKNGKGKEYNDNNKLKFEGEYLNGKRNGIGKEYNDAGELMFEGEYLYNYKKKGKYYIKGKLEYEGEFLYNKKYKGKGYDENGNIIYELINGNGKVKEYNDNGALIFEGEYLNGKKNNRSK